MHSTLKLIVLGFLGCFASLANANGPDEAQAHRFLYCANVIQFYYQNLLKYEPNNPNITTYRLTRDNFRFGAAATKSFPDSQSFVAANDAAIAKVNAVLEKEKMVNADLMRGEAKSCAETMTKEVVPLLKPKNVPSN